MCGRPAAAQAVTQGDARARYCVGCGRAMPWDMEMCQHCGHDYRAPRKDASGDHLVVGGVLTTMAGVFSLVFTTIILFSTGDLADEGIAMAAVIYACGFMGILGGMLALTRNLFPFAVLGAACSVMGPAFFIGIPGLVLIAKSSARFKGGPR